MGKFQVGDVVRILTKEEILERFKEQNLEVRREYNSSEYIRMPSGVCVNDSMFKLGGTITKISEVFGNWEDGRYTIENGRSFTYTDEMLERIEPIDFMGKEFVCSLCGEVFKVESEDDYNILKCDYNLPVCKDCKENSCYTCDDCGRLCPSDEMTYIEGGDKEVCKRCLDLNYVTCEDCGDIVHEDYAYSAYRNGRNVTICEYCRDDHYYTCYDCGDIIHEDDAHWDDDDPYCDYCWNNRDCNDEICDYHEGPDLRYFDENGENWELDHTNFKGYGFELEVDCGGHNGDNARRVREILNNEVYCMNDGSIHDGFEIITHPHTRAAIEKLPIHEAFEFLKSEGYKSHDAGTCGLHLHASRLLFGNCEKTRTTNITKMVLFYETFWNNILKISRRSESRADEWAAKYCLSKENIRERVLQSEKGDRWGLARYKAVNLCNKYTIEFRLMRGTLNESTFWATLDFLMTTIENCKKIRVDEVNNAKLWLKNMKKETLEYIKSRGAFVSVIDELLEGGN